MRSISIVKTEPSPSDFNEAAEVLREGGLVAFPCSGSYRIAADVNNEKAVIRLFQSKRRTRNTPSLVFVSNLEMLRSITCDLHPLIHRVTERIWPGDLTVKVEPRLDLSRKLVKRMSRPDNKIGVRVPASTVARKIVDTFNGPVLVSSANVEKKKGAYSLAQVRKNFAQHLDLFFYAGDLTDTPHSTVVDVKNEAVVILRPGRLSAEEIEKAAS